MCSFIQLPVLSSCEDTYEALNAVISVVCAWKEIKALIFILLIIELLVHTYSAPVCGLHVTGKGIMEAQYR